ncbi:MULTISPECIES: hypothetical protein [Aeromonas]|uniref:hypothetical protein n=1 Tax=Aeromonas TaxID=642 RepID=UPI00111797D6|nr:MULTISPECIES: hypothetical protein [Aeromonas]MBL0675197.1 hypothetical protein [Aeromonas dhakensis]WAF99159.1 hypothetical protein NRZ31_22665 [Aeromonas dhakensis]
MSGIFLSTADLQKLTHSAREEVLSIVSGGFDSAFFESNSVDGPTDLSSIQAEKLVKGLSPKSRTVLKAIVDSRNTTNGFWCEELAEELEIDVSELTGVWSGLTRRIRTVTGSSEAYLIAWSWDEEKQDFFGSLHPITVKNCKKALNII